MGLVETTDNLYDTKIFKKYIRSVYEISAAYLSPEMHCHLNNPEVIVTAKTDIW